MPNKVDRDFSGASAWADVDLDAYDETGDLTITASAADQYCTLVAASAPTTATKRYQMTFDVANLVETWTIKSFDGTQTIGTVSADGPQVFEWTATTAGGYRIVAVANTSSGDFDNFSEELMQPTASMIERVANAETFLIDNEPVDYSAGALLELVKDGTTATMFWDGAIVDTEQTVAVDGVIHGEYGDTDLCGDEVIIPLTYEAQALDNSEFADVTITNIYTSDFSAGADSFTALRGAAAGNIDGIGGQDNNLRFTCDDTNNTHALKLATVVGAGKQYNVELYYYIPSGQSNIDGVSFKFSSGFATGAVLDAWTKVDTDTVIAGGTDFTAFGSDGGNLTFTDAGGDDVFYLRAIIIDEITLDDWTVSGTRDATAYLVYEDSKLQIVTDADVIGVYQATANTTLYKYAIDIDAVVSGALKITNTLGSGSYASGITTDTTGYIISTSAFIDLVRSTGSDNVTVNSLKLWPVVTS